MNQIRIRSAEVRDAAGIAYVHVRAWQETYRGLMPDSVLDTLSVERRTEQWKNTLADASDTYHRVLVAEIDHKVVGFANYGSERERDPQYTGELYAVYVLKEFQGQSLGRALIQKAAKGLLELDLNSMLVWVLANNPYQRFYERLGGVCLREKQLPIGDVILSEKAYGWRDIRPLAERKDGR